MFGVSVVVMATAGVVCTSLLEPVVFPVLYGITDFSLRSHENFDAELVEHLDGFPPQATTEHCFNAFICE
jgi:hypothetical protein